AADMFEDESELAMGHGCELLAGKFLLDKQKWLEATTLFTTIADADGIEPELRKAALLGLTTALRGRGDEAEAQRVQGQAERIAIDEPLAAEYEFIAEAFFED